MWFCGRSSSSPNFLYLKKHLLCLQNVSNTVWLVSNNQETNYAAVSFFFSFRFHTKVQYQFECAWKYATYGEFTHLDMSGFPGQSTVEYFFPLGRETKTCASTYKKGVGENWWLKFLKSHMTLKEWTYVVVNYSLLSRGYCSSWLQLNALIIQQKKCILTEE